MQKATLIDLAEAKAVYHRGENVTAFLKNKYAGAVPLSDIIEVAYDLQAGTYIQYTNENPAVVAPYWTELSGLINTHAGGCHSLLDVGTGELTTYTAVLKGMKTRPEALFAFDLSWSRLQVGRAHGQATHPAIAGSTHIFCADMANIPLPSNSIDLVISSHALEPNRDQQDRLLTELLRVARHRLMLFEPCYEINSAEGQARMDAHGYIKDLDSSIARAGGRLMDKIPLEAVINPLNPTVCYLIGADAQARPEPRNGAISFTVPGTDEVLEREEGFLVSRTAGLAFPVLQGIPLLRAKQGIVATAL